MKGTTSQDQANIIAGIRFIDTEVDFVPETIQVYKSLPEPHRQEALARLISRRIEFDQIAKAQKRSFE